MGSRVTGSASSNSISGAAVRNSPRQPSPSVSVAAREWRNVTARSSVSSLQMPSRSTAGVASPDEAPLRPMAKNSVNVSPAVAGAMLASATVLGRCSSKGNASEASQAIRV